MTILQIFNPYLMNGFAHHLGESIVILGVAVVISKFFDEISLSKQNNPRWDAVCLCPVKGTPGLNELTILNIVRLSKKTYIQALIDGIFPSVFR